MNEPQIGGGTKAAHTAESEVERLRLELAACKVAALRAGEPMTEKSRLEADFEEDRRRLSTVIDNTFDVVCSLDTHLTLTFHNAAFQSLWHRLSTEPLHEEGQNILQIVPEDVRPRFARSLAAGLQGQRVSYEEDFGRPDLAQYELSICPILGPDAIAGITLFGRDISRRKRSERDISAQQSQLLELSRLAGMSQVASDVLHNVGNVLNSINVSVGVLLTRIDKLPVEPLSRVSVLLKEQSSDLARFFTEDARGKVVPELISRLAEMYGKERSALSTEIQALQENVQHVARIISSQQTLGKTMGVEEVLAPKDLIESALGINSAAFADNRIEVVQELDEVPPVSLDRHVLLQILVNLLSNARHALRDSERENKRLVIRLRNMSDRLHIEVEDNGVGISDENMPKLFKHGFTTKQDGHGFGLHSAESAAEALGGSLTAESEGPGKGAKFRLDLPIASK